MKDLYNKIENYFQYEKADSVYVTLFKSLILLVSGGYFGLILRELNSEPQIINLKHIAFLLVGISTFVYIEYRRLRKEKNFPVTILEHLTATEELKSLKEKYSRKNKLYDFIDNSIQSLNSNTCPVMLTPDNFLCHQDLEAGLRNVLLDLVERPHYILNVDETKFTVGTFIKELYDKNSPVGQIENLEKTFIFRDDLNLIQHLPESPYQLDSEQEGSFQFQTATLEVLNFNKFLCKTIVLDNQTFTLICSPIPNVCESCPPDGIIFAIYKGAECCSTDIDSVLLIFGRILSNWVAKYNDCVRREKQIKLNDTHNHKKVEIPKEVLDIIEKNKNEGQ
jgi:hypothetical protein